MDAEDQLVDADVDATAEETVVLAMIATIPCTVGRMGYVCTQEDNVKPQQLDTKSQPPWQIKWEVAHVTVRIL